MPDEQQPMTNAEYAATKLHTCPFCRLTEVNSLRGECWCRVCGKRWEEVYDVVGYVEIVDEED